MKSLFAFLVVNLFALSSFAVEPDLRRLSHSGFIMGPGNASYPVHRSWDRTIRFMAQVAVFDNLVDRIEAVLCSDEDNRSVLLVGEPSETYKYIFARLAARKMQGCPKDWHIDIDINKIEAGHKYVGEVDQYWRNYILTPSDQKDVVLYFRDLDGLMGLGSHSHDPTGIEAEYAANIQAGRFKSVVIIMNAPRAKSGRWRLS